MADFCSNCCVRMNFNVLVNCNKDPYETINPDIDVFKIFDQCEPGTCRYGFICEGCGLIAILKTDDGKLKVVYSHSKPLEGGLPDWVDYKDYRKVE